MHITRANRAYLRRDTHSQRERTEATGFEDLAATLRGLGTAELSGMSPLQCVSHASGGRPCLQVLLDSPILLESELNAIATDKVLGSRTFRIFFETGKPGALEASLRK